MAFWHCGFVTKKLSPDVITVKDQLALSKNFIELSEINWKCNFARQQLVIQYKCKNRIYIDTIKKVSQQLANLKCQWLQYDTIGFLQT